MSHSFIFVLRLKKRIFAKITYRFVPKNEKILLLFFLIIVYFYMHQYEYFWQFLLTILFLTKFVKQEYS